MKIKVYEKDGLKRLVAEFESEERARQYFNPEYYEYKILVR